MKEQDYERLPDPPRLGQNEGVVHGDDVLLVSMTIGEKSACSLSEPIAPQTKLPAVTGPAVNFSISAIVDRS